MRARLRFVACLILAAVALLSAGPALAQGGTSTSAGDQQYIDPLTGTKTTTQKSSSAASPSTTPTASASSGAATATSSSAPTPSSSAPSTRSGAAAHTPGDALPYTGLNVGILIIAGVALLGGGLLLRRVARRA